MPKFAEIALQQKFGIDQETLTYQIPENLTVQTGHLVAISLRNKLTTGLVWEIHNQIPKFKTIEIKGLINEQPILSKAQIDLIKWLS